MRGLIAAALGGLSKGVGQVATAQIEINARKALMEAEEEMRARLAEAAEGRAEKRLIAAEGRAETQQIAAEGRAISNIPLTAEATAKAEEANMARRYGEGSEYPGLLGSQMKAMETLAQRATREAAEYDLGRKQAQDKLIEQLATETDPTKQKQLRQQLTAMGTEFKGDDAEKMRLESLYDQITELTKGQTEALKEENFEVAAQFESKIKGIKDTIAGKPEFDPNSFLTDVQQIFSDPNATDADRSDAIRTGVSLGVFPSEEEGRKRFTPAAAAAAPVASTPPKPDLQSFEGYSVPPQDLGSAVSRGVETASGVLSEALTVNPEVQARATRTMQVNAAQSVLKEMTVNKRLPSVATLGDRQRVEAAIASRDLPPAIEETLKRYLAETAK